MSVLTSFLIQYDLPASTYRALLWWVKGTVDIFYPDLHHYVAAHMYHILCFTNQCQIIVFIYQWKTEPHTYTHTHPVNPKTAHVDSQQSQWPSGVCCPELALQPARVPCWFKRQVGWPGNESCLYEAWEHKEWLSGSGRWPRLGQLSSLSAKHNLSFGRVPNTCSPWNLSEPLTKQGTWIKLQ